MSNFFRLLGQTGLCDYIMVMAMDESGILVTCPQCGQRNRVRYNRLQEPFRCAKCKTELQLPPEPLDVPGEAAFLGLTSQNSLPVLVDFWASWCGPCKMVAPHLRQVAAAMSGKLIVAKVNTESLPQLAARFHINAIPTLVVLKNGQEVARQAGALAAPAIRQFVQPWVR